MKRKALFLFGVNIFERSNFKMNWIRKDFPQGFNVHVNVEPAIGLVLKMLQYRGLFNNIVDSFENVTNQCKKSKLA